MKPLYLALMLLFSATVSATPYLWQTNTAGNDIHIYNLDNLELVRRLEVGANPHGFAVPEDNRSVYVSLEKYGSNHGEILQINPFSLKIEQRIEVCREPQNITTTPNGKFLYVPCFNGQYWVIDTASGKVVKKIETGGRPHNTEVSRDGRYVYLSPLRKVNGVTVVDVLAENQVDGFIPFGGQVRPLSLSRDGQLLFQHVDGVDGFKVADTNQKAVVKVVEHHSSLGRYRYAQHLVNRISRKLGYKKIFEIAHCHGLKVRPDQQEIWSTCGSNLNIHDLDREDYPQTGHINLGGTGYWLSFSLDSRLSAVALPDRNQVAIINTSDMKIVKYLNVGKRPKRNMVINHDIELQAAK